MSKRNKPSTAPTFYDFVRACISDQALAGEMIRKDRAWLTKTSSVGETALHYLAIENYLDAVKWLIGRGADVNAAEGLGKTPLMNASQLGYEAMVAVLLEAGADVMVVDELNGTALSCAARNGHVEICEQLIKAGSTVRDAASLVASAPRRKRDALTSLFESFGHPSPD